METEGRKSLLCKDDIPFGLRGLPCSARIDSGFYAFDLMNSVVDPDPTCEVPPVQLLISGD